MERMKKGERERVEGREGGRREEKKGRKGRRKGGREERKVWSSKSRTSS